MGKRFGGVAALVRKSALEWGRTQIGSENYNFFRYKGTKK